MNTDIPDEVVVSHWDLAALANSRQPAMATASAIMVELGYDLVSYRATIEEA